MYSLTIAGKHGHIAPITTEEPIIKKISKKQYILLSSGEICDYVFKEQKSISNLMGAKQKCIDIIHTNLQPNSIFLTLTTQACLTEKDRAVYFEYMRLFCKTEVFRRCFGTSYLYTVEKQDGNRRADKIGRGALHSHFICFNPLLSFLPYKELIEAWRKVIGGLGSVKIKKIDKPENIGKYLAKYILKEFASVERYKRVYIPSLDLKKPEKRQIKYKELVEFSKKHNLKEKRAIIEGEEKIVGWYW